jgi:hypothetical protein
MIWEERPIFSALLDFRSAGGGLKDRVLVAEVRRMLRRAEMARPKHIPWRLFALEVCVVLVLVTVLMIVGRV